MLDLFIGFVVRCAVGYVARDMLLRYRRERVRRERVEGRHGLRVKVRALMSYLEAHKMSPAEAGLEGAHH